MVGIIKDPDVSGVPTLLSNIISDLIFVWSPTSSYNQNFTVVWKTKQIFLWIHFAPAAVVMLPLADVRIVLFCSECLPVFQELCGMVKGQQKVSSCAEASQKVINVPFLAVFV